LKLTIAACCDWFCSFALLAVSCKCVWFLCSSVAGKTHHAACLPTCAAVWLSSASSRRAMRKRFASQVARTCLMCSLFGTRAATVQPPPLWILFDDLSPAALFGCCCHEHTLFQAASIYHRSCFLCAKPPSIVMSCYAKLSNTTFYSSAQDIAYSINVDECCTIAALPCSCACAILGGPSFSTTAQGEQWS